MNLFWRHQAADIANTVPGWVQFSGRPTVILQYWTDCTIGSIGHAGELQSSNLSNLIIIGIPICPICQNSPICPICQKIQSCNLPSHPISDLCPSVLHGLVSHDYKFCPIGPIGGRSSIGPIGSGRRPWHDGVYVQVDFPLINLVPELASVI